MILCSDYNPDECPVECLYASNTEGYIQQPDHSEFFTASCLYGTDACSLSWRRKPVYEVKDSLDELRTDISRAVDEALEKILINAGIDMRYFELHPQEFKLKTSNYYDSILESKSYDLYHDDILLGTCEVSYVPADKTKLILKGENDNGKS